MSYKVYNNWYNAKMKNEELKDGSNEDYLEDKIFNHIKACFDGIYNIAKFNKKLYFNLKENWTLLRSHDYDAVLVNICEWLKKADDRFDGENWTEKVQSPKTTGKIITGKENLQKYYEILSDNENFGIIEHDNGVTYITGNDLEFEIDDEEEDRIYFDTPSFEIDYKYYKQGIKTAIIEVLVENGVNNFKINKRAGEIKFYQ